MKTLVQVLVGTLVGAVLGFGMVGCIEVAHAAWSQLDKLLLGDPFTLGPNDEAAATTRLRVDGAAAFKCGAPGPAFNYDIMGFMCRNTQGEPGFERAGVMRVPDALIVEKVVGVNAEGVNFLALLNGDGMVVGLTNEIGPTMKPRAAFDARNGRPISLDGGCLDMRQGGTIKASICLNTAGALVKRLPDGIETPL